MVGESRVGKSTFYNNIMGVRLIGYEEDFELSYVPDFEDGAQVKNTFKSVTILPNIEHLEIENENCVLQDMAGYNDKNRGYLGTFMVSFMLVETFKYVEDAKFILVC